MTAIEFAMQKAGVALPSITKRIWTWVKDHPDATALEVATAVGYDQAQTLLGQMHGRKMLTRKQDVNRKGKAVYRYRAMHPTYEEALAYSVPLHKAKRTTHQPPPGVLKMVPGPIVAAPPKSSVDKIIDMIYDLKLSEVAELKRRLNKLVDEV